MDSDFEAFFGVIKDAFARDAIQIGVAFKPGGDVDYVYRKHRLLALDDGDNIERLQRIFPWIRPAEERTPGRLVVLSYDDAEGRPSVPDALDIIDEEHPRDAAAADEGAPPLATPDHMVDIVRLCPATEPEVPPGNVPGPWPEPRSAMGEYHRRVRLAVSDTGLVAGAADQPWMNGVVGDPDPLEERPGRPPLIPGNAGHGAFVAGVARCLAPSAEVFVANHFATSGADLESSMADKLAAMIRTQAPDIINLSAGSYTRRDWTSLAFESFYREHRDILSTHGKPLPEEQPRLTLIAAAGNDSTCRKFWPAAFDWAISVGSVGPDEQNRAWFSNYGDWVDVYALGEGVVNAYATGEYVYQVPPRRPATQTFDGLALWSGTSFAAPVVAGMIAEVMARTGRTADESARAVLDRAVPIDGIGRVLHTRF